MTPYDLEQALMLTAYGRREVTDDLTDEEVRDIYAARGEAARLRQSLIEQHRVVSALYFDLLELDKEKLMDQLYLGGASYESVGIVFGVPTDKATKLVRRHRAERRARARKESRAEARDATTKGKR
ncbi:hypothetical protein K0U83_18030 [bacterium]|jgi:hypothetical protein|nr:hypothetical protein [bacterium]